MSVARYLKKKYLLCCFIFQVKFSELTIDMFRMLQALEREPVNLATQSSKPGTLVREDSYTLPVTIYVECF